MDFIVKNVSGSCFLPLLVSFCSCGVCAANDYKPSLKPAGSTGLAESPPMNVRRSSCKRTAITSTMLPAFRALLLKDIRAYGLGLEIRSSIAFEKNELRKEAVKDEDIFEFELE